MEKLKSLPVSPESFNALLQELGVPNAETEEIYNLDALDELKPVYGLFFIADWLPGPYRAPFEYHDPFLFFPSQIDKGFTGTQCVLSILLNSGVSLSPELTEIRESVLPLSPQLKGLTMWNCEFLRNSHTKLAEEHSTQYQFLSYVHVNGILYEFSEVRAGPVKLGESLEDEWIDKVKPVLQERINQFLNNEICFSMFALIKSRKYASEREIERLRSQIECINSKIKGEESPHPLYSELPDGIDTLKELYNARTQRICVCEEIITSELEKPGKWGQEDPIRKFDYTPFIAALLENLHSKGRLVPLIEHSKRRRTETN